MVSEQELGEFLQKQEQELQAVCASGGTGWKLVKNKAKRVKAHAAFA